MKGWNVHTVKQSLIKSLHFCFRFRLIWQSQWLLNGELQVLDSYLMTLQMQLEFIQAQNTRWTVLWKTPTSFSLNLGCGCCSKKTWGCEGLRLQAWNRKSIRQLWRPGQGCWHWCKMWKLFTSLMKPLLGDLHWCHQYYSPESCQDVLERWKSCALRETPLHERQGDQRIGGFGKSQKGVLDGSCLEQMPPSLPGLFVFCWYHFFIFP